MVPRCCCDDDEEDTSPEDCRDEASDSIIMSPLLRTTCLRREGSPVGSNISCFLTRFASALWLNNSAVQCSARSTREPLFLSGLEGDSTR